MSSPLPARSSRFFWKTAARALWVVLCLGLALAFRVENLRDVFIEGKIFFVDADCYARMSRVRLVAEHPGMIVRRHDFENFPDGVRAHTTAPLDYAIFGLQKILDAGFALFDQGKTSLLHAQTRDLAGALIGPLLGLAGGLFLALWGWQSRRLFWEPALLLYALSPILVHGTTLGRPDHQALLIPLFLVALAAELTLADLPTDSSESEQNGSTTKSVQRWSMVSGAAWALSLWVSLYEPGVLFLLVLALWVFGRPRGLFCRERVAGTILFALILGGALLLEGWPIEWPDAARRAAFAHWQRTIGELTRIDLFSSALPHWLGWTFWLAPVLWLWPKSKTALKKSRAFSRGFGPPLFLAALTALTLWQARWGYFLALGFVLALPEISARLRRPWLVWLVSLLALWPVLQEWDARFFPGEEMTEPRDLQRAEKQALRSLVESRRGAPGEAFIAPWWLSPAIAYWSRCPGVAGSSHESLPGILDTARFYLATDPEEAAAILRAHQVRWVLSESPTREIQTSRLALGLDLPKSMSSLDATHAAPQPSATAPLPLAELLDRHEQPPEWLATSPSLFLRPPQINAFDKIWTVEAF